MLLSSSICKLFMYLQCFCNTKRHPLTRHRLESTFLICWGILIQRNPFFINLLFIVLRNVIQHSPWGGTTTGNLTSVWATELETCSFSHTHLKCLQNFCLLSVSKFYLLIFFLFFYLFKIKKPAEKNPTGNEQNFI